MGVHFIPGRGFDSNIYLIVDKMPTLIDTGLGLNHSHVVKEIENHISIEEVRQIILTHEHIDHCRGAKKIIEEIGNKVKVMAHIYAAEKLEKEGNKVSEFFGVFMPSIEIEKKLRDGDVVSVGDGNLQVIYTPGHSPGSICLYNDTEKMLFSGDTVFSDGGFGRYDFPGGDPFMLLESIERLSSLDIKNLYPGHGEIVIGNGNKHIRTALHNLRLLI